MKLTIKDIAKLSGVGKSTVSRVLNQDPNVSDATREKVEKIILEQGFTPSNSARAMRGVGNPVIGIIVTRLTSTSENQVLSTLLPKLYEKNCEPIIVESRFDAKLVQEHLNFFRKKRVSAVILFSFSDIEQMDLAEWQQKMVVIARQHRDICSVYYDDQSAVRLLMNALQQKNHHNIAYIGVDDHDTTTGKLRHQTYQDYCRENALLPHSVQGDLSYQSGYNLAQLIDFKKFSAIVCATDTIALGVIKYLQEQQLTHIYVCGIGNNPLLHFLFPQIITVDLGFEKAGYYVVKQLFELLSGESQLSHYCLPCTLIE